MAKITKKILKEIILKEMKSQFNEEYKFPEELNDKYSKDEILFTIKLLSDLLVYADNSVYKKTLSDAIKILQDTSELASNMKGGV